MIFNKLIDINLKDYWLHGRLNYLKDSPNISKLLNLLTSKLNDIIYKMNRVYPSIYPCLGVELLQQHAIELGIPDKIFKTYLSYYCYSKFCIEILTYTTFPKQFSVFPHFI